MSLFESKAPNRKADVGLERVSNLSLNDIIALLPPEVYLNLWEEGLTTETSYDSVSKVLTLNKVRSSYSINIPSGDISNILIKGSPAPTGTEITIIFNNSPNPSCNLLGTTVGGSFSIPGRVIGNYLIGATIIKLYKQASGWVILSDSNAMSVIKIVYKGVINIGDIGTDAFFSHTFTGYTPPDANYQIIGTLRSNVTSDGDANNNNDCAFVIYNRLTTGFKIGITNGSGSATQSLFFDFILVY